MANISILSILIVAPTVALAQDLDALTRRHEDGQRAARELIENFATSSDLERHAAVRRALAGIAGVAALAEALDDERPSVWVLSCEALGAIAASKPNTTASRLARHLLLDTLDAPRPGLPLRAALVLAQGELGEEVQLRRVPNNAPAILEAAQRLVGQRSGRSDHPVALELQALRQLAAGGLHEALAAASRLSEQYPKIASGPLRRAEARFALKDYRGALTDLDHARLLAPRLHEVHFLRGKAHQMLDEHALALADYDAAIELFPYHAPSWANRATVKRRRGSPDEALRDVSRAIALEPANAEVLMVRVRIRWLALRQAEVDYAAPGWEEVRADLARALVLDPKLGAAYGRRGYLSAQAGRTDEALRDYDLAITSDPDDGYVWQGQRGLLRHRLGRLSEALADFDAYLARAASNHQIYRSVTARRAEAIARLAGRPRLY